MLPRSQALLKGSIFINSLKSHSSVPEVRVYYYAYFKGKEMEALKFCSAINQTELELDLRHNGWHCGQNGEDTSTIREHPGQGGGPVSEGPSKQVPRAEKFPIKTVRS